MIDTTSELLDDQLANMPDNQFCILMRAMERAKVQRAVGTIILPNMGPGSTEKVQLCSLLYKTCGLNIIEAKKACENNAEVMPVSEKAFKQLQDFLDQLEH